MIPITIARMNNYSGFLLSLDKVTWWKSEPLPAEVDSFTDAVWVYGQYHICSAKLISGPYAIFCSNDNGYSWDLVLSTSEEIKCLLRPDYGRAIAATSGGWWRSENSGATWTKVSTQAPGCHIVKELSKDVLVALDGTYIWRSTNCATTWTKAVKNGTATPVTAVTHYPTVDGTSSDCVVGCISSNCSMTFIDLGFSGPFSSPTTPGDEKLDVSESSKAYKDILLYSSDGAVSFVACEPDSGWAFREATYSIGPPITSGTSNNGWQTGPYKGYYHNNLFPRNTYTDTITDIEMTGVNTLGLPQFVIQVKMSNGLLRHYWVRRIKGVASVNKQFWTVAKFDANSSMSDSLSSEESLMTGNTDVQQLAIFSGTTADFKPLMKVSSTGGETWTDYNVSTAVVYEGPDLSQISSSNPFSEDSYLKYAWDYPLCHNGWHVVSGYTERGQSYDMDMFLGLPITHEQTYTMDYETQIPREKTFHADLLICKPKLKQYLYDILVRSKELFTYQMDVLTSKAELEQFTMDALNQKVCLEQFTMDALTSHFWTELYALDEWVRKVCLEQFDMDIISVFHFTETYLMDSLIQKVCIKNLIMDVLQEGLNDDSYSMDIKIQDTITLDILHNTERYHWQGAAIGIGYPRSSYPIFDSRKETKT